MTATATETPLDKPLLAMLQVLQTTGEISCAACTVSHGATEAVRSFVRCPQGPGELYMELTAGDPPTDGSLDIQLQTPQMQLRVTRTGVRQELELEVTLIEGGEAPGSPSSRLTLRKLATLTSGDWHHGEWSCGEWRLANVLLSSELRDVSVRLLARFKELPDSAVSAARATTGAGAADEARRQVIAAADALGIDF